MNTIESLAARVSAQDTLIRDLSEQLARLRETLETADAIGHAVRIGQWTHPDGPSSAIFDLITHLQRQIAWSLKTFGPGDRAAGVIDHIRKELKEIEAAPTDLSEWIDVAILAFDGAHRAGHTAEQIAAALLAKQQRNEQRQWPDWRTMPTDRAIEHVRSESHRTPKVFERTTLDLQIAAHNYSVERAEEIIGNNFSVLFTYSKLELELREAHFAGSRSKP